MKSIEDLCEAYREAIEERAAERVKDNAGRLEDRRVDNARDAIVDTYNEKVKELEDKIESLEKQIAEG